MPNCAKCGTKLEYMGGHFNLNTNGPLSKGHRFWRCSTCNRSVHEPVAYDHANDILLVNQEGE